MVSMSCLGSAYSYTYLPVDAYNELHVTFAVLHVLVGQHWKDQLKSHMLHRARWLHNTSAAHAHDPTASLPTVLEARVAAGLELPRVEVVTGQEEGEEGLVALVGFVVMRAPREIFREIVGMLPVPKG
jgi:hypothetical protein